MITTKIDLGPVTFEDVAYEGWSFSELVDWWGQTDDKDEVRERPRSHGAFDSRQSLRSSRAISFKARFIGDDQAAFENALDALSAVGADTAVRMAVTTPAGATARLVKVVRAKPEDHRGRRTGVVNVDLIANDPRRYKLEEASPWLSTPPMSAGGGLQWPLVWPLTWPAGGSSGRIILTNTGKAPSAPMFRLYGGFDTALITCTETGARVGLDRFVPAGSVVEIDTQAHVATIDGQSDVSTWLRYREWELVPPGESRTFQFDVTGGAGSPLMEGRVLSAWW